MKIILLLVILIQTQLFTQWQEIESPKSIQSIRNLNSGNDFLIGSDFDVYFSFDEGINWEKRTNGLPENRDDIEQIEVENNLSVISTFSTFKVEKQFVYYSNDKGKNWSNLIYKLDSNMLFLDFKIENNDIYLFSIIPRKIYKSTDLGMTWDSTISFEESEFKPHKIQVKNDTIVVAKKGGNVIGGGLKKGGIQISTNNGATWEERNVGLNTENMKCLKINKDNIYVGGENGFYYTEDLGVTWKSPGTLVVGAKVNDVEIIRDTVYLATENGLYKAKDLFKGWEEIPFFKGKRVWQMHYEFEKLFIRALQQDYSNDYCYYSIDNEFDNFIQLNFVKNSILRDFEIDYPKIYIASKNIDLNEDLGLDNTIIFKSDSTLELSHLSKFEDNLVCSYLPLSPNASNKTLLYSTNSGLSWENIILYSELTNLNISDLFILNRDTLLVVTFNNGISISISFNNELIPFKTNDSKINDLLSKIHSLKRFKNKIIYYGTGVILESDINLKNWIDYSHQLNTNTRIFDVSIDKNVVFVITHSGGVVEPSTLNVIKSKNNGDSWINLNYKFSKYSNFWPKNIFYVDEYVFLSTQSGIFLSKDNGDIFEKINDGLTTNAKISGGEFHLYGDKILFCSQSGIFYRDLEELGITLTSVEKTEKRNYLYTFPPFPQPTKQEVKISTYWDSALPFTVDDVEIYNLAGIKINTENKLSINKETNYNGHIIWDTSGEQAGIYIVNIKHGTETRTQKVMVME